MKRLTQFLCAIALMFTITACSSVPAGYEGVKVYLLGTSKGVQSEQLGVGRYWIGFNEELYTFPTFTQNYVWTNSHDEGKDNNDESITFQTVEGMSINANVGISYHIDPNNVVKVFQKYRKGIDDITHVALRNEVRDAMSDEASVMNVEHIYGDGKVAFMNRVNARVIKDMEKVGVTVEKLYIVGSLRLPEQITAALNAKIEATQHAVKAENQLREAYATAKRDSIVAAGHNKANHQLEQSLSPALLQKMWIDKWLGTVPTTVVMSSANQQFVLPGYPSGK